MKFFYVAATLILVSILNLQAVQSIQNYEDDSILEEQSSKKVARVKRTLDIDYPKILTGLLSPATISNQFTDILLFQTIIAVGWVTGGILYQLAKQVDFGEETNSRVEQMGFWFETDKFPASMGINIRNQIFGFFLGRVIYDIITDPVGTREEFESITWTELRNRMLSNKYLATWLGRFVFQFFLVIMGIAVLYGISSMQNTLFESSKVSTQFRSLDDLNNSVQTSLLKDYAWK